jgi:hypothetical protein
MRLHFNHQTNDTLGIHLEYHPIEQLKQRLYIRMALKFARACAKTVSRNRLLTRPIKTTNIDTLPNQLSDTGDRIWLTLRSRYCMTLTDSRWW